MCPPRCSVLGAYNLAMASDELWIAADGNFDQVVPVSVVGRIASYVGSVIGMVVGRRWS